MIQRASGFDNPQIKLGDFLGVCAFHHDDHISLFEGELLIDRISVKCLREAKSQDIRNYLNRTVSRLFFHEYGVWHVYLTPERPVVEPRSFNDVPKHTTLVADIISMVSEKQVITIVDGDNAVFNDRMEYLAHTMETGCASSLCWREVEWYETGTESNLLIYLKEQEMDE